MNEVSKLERCPFCGSKAHLVAREYDEGYEAIIYCTGGAEIGCFTKSRHWAAKKSWAIKSAKEAWNRRAVPPNEALTLEQLQPGDVVWLKDFVMGEIECLRFDRIEPATYHAGEDYRFEQFGTETGIIRWACKYGKTWLAYLRKPEPEGGASDATV